MDAERWNYLKNLKPGSGRYTHTSCSPHATPRGLRVKNERNAVEIFERTGVVPSDAPRGKSYRRAA